MPPMKPKKISDRNRVFYISSRKGGMTPRRLAQPFEHAAIEAVAPLCRPDRARHGEAVDHRAHHRQIHHIASVNDLPARIQARLGEQMMGRGELQEQDVHQERGPADLLAERLRTDQERCDQIPDRDMRRDVDLLRGMPHRPPHDLVHQGIDVGDKAKRPQPGGNQDDGTGAIVNTAMMAAVSAPNVTSGIEPSYVLSSRAITSVARKIMQPINAPTANRMRPR